MEKVAELREKLKEGTGNWEIVLTRLHLRFFWLYFR
jgi:hypothetical protein